MIKPITLYHGTLLKNVSSICKYGIKPSSGWIEWYPNKGVFLAATQKEALKWAKISYLIDMGHKREDDPSHFIFDKKYKKYLPQLVVLKVTIPPQFLKNLKLDLNQLGDFDIDPNNWKASLEISKSVMYRGTIPSKWIKWA